ncbi:unnamed protein product, partial [Phyllotreta striolata]
MCSPCGPCAPPPNPVLFPAAMCCMVTPPPICPPTYPEPVKPLMITCPKSCGPWPNLTSDQEYILRYSNFYNNYNSDYHTSSPCDKPGKCDPGVGVCGPPKYCTDVRRRKKRPRPEDAGCPTGFKPCYMKMFPPADNHPCGVWCAEVQLCFSKPKYSNFYKPGPCKRPCCKHRPCTPPCCYDLPCKAACMNHPPGIH